MVRRLPLNDEKGVFIGTNAEALHPDCLWLVKFGIPYCSTSREWSHSCATGAC